MFHCFLCLKMCVSSNNFLSCTFWLANCKYGAPFALDRAHKRALSSEDLVSQGQTYLQQVGRNCILCVVVFLTLIPSTKLTSSSHKTFHFSYMKFLDEMFIKVKVSSIFKEKKSLDRMSTIRTRSIRFGVHHSNPYTTENLVTNFCLI